MRTGIPLSVEVTRLKKQPGKQQKSLYQTSSSLDRSKSLVYKKVDNCKDA